MTNSLRQKSGRVYRIALLVIVLILAFLLGYYNFGNDGYGNLYYSAAIKSMTASWHNFFFVSFDPAGFVNVDKPPVALWIQACFVKLLGFHSFSLMLPEALASAFSVYILFQLVRRAFGYAAGILAALMLTFTPIFIATTRSNNPDAILVLVLLLAGWAVTAAAEKGSLLHLVLAAVFVGIGFNTKMLVAFLIVPACIAVYCCTSKIKWTRKLLHLTAAAFVLLIVSFSWVEAVDLVPSSQRPYVGSSTTNSEMNLVFGYNGLNRVFSHQSLSKNRMDQRNMDLVQETSEAAGAVPVSPYKKLASPGFLRFASRALAEQISWFLPLAIFGVIAAFLYIQKLSRAERRNKIISLVLWGGWSAVMVTFFSLYRDLTHLYYLNIVAPGLAALGGIGISCLVKLAVENGKRPEAILLSSAFAASAFFQIYVISQYPAWLGFLYPIDVVCVVLALSLPFIRKSSRIPLLGVSALCVVSLLVIPAVWSSIAVIAHVSGSDAYGGPKLLRKVQKVSVPSAGELMKQLEFKGNDPVRSSYYKGLEVYLKKNRGGAEYLAAAPNAALAENIIIDTGQPVMAIGGFSGSNPIVSLQQFQTLVSKGKVHYFIADKLSSKLIDSKAALHSTVERPKRIEQKIDQPMKINREKIKETQNHMKISSDTQIFQWVETQGTVIDRQGYLKHMDSNTTRYCLYRLPGSLGT